MNYTNLLELFTKIPESIQTGVFQAILAVLFAIIIYAPIVNLLKLITKRVVKKSILRQNPKALENEVTKRTNTLTSVITNIWRIVCVFGVGLFIANLIFSDQIISSIFTSAGFLGVAVAFGSQSLIKDFITGMFIVSENQYRVGDFVEIDNFSGTVEKIGSRSTVVRDVEGNLHFFPHGTIVHVINMTMDYSKARFVVSIDPESDMHKAIELINETGKEMYEDKTWENQIIEPPHYLLTSGVTGIAIDLTVTGKVQASKQWDIISEMRIRLLNKFENNNIVLAVGNTTTQSSILTNKK